jgi:hypothetical protein
MALESTEHGGKTDGFIVANEEELSIERRSESSPLVSASFRSQRLDVVWGRFMKEPDRRVLAASVITEEVIEGQESQENKSPRLTFHDFLSSHLA